MLWLGVAKGSTNLSLGRGPNQARDLREDVDQDQNGAGTSVKEVYLAIVELRHLLELALGQCWCGHMSSTQHDLQIWGIRENPRNENLMRCTPSSDLPLLRCLFSSLRTPILTP